jgi:hypothetical protein
MLSQKLVTRNKVTCDLRLLFPKMDQEFRWIRVAAGEWLPRTGLVERPAAGAHHPLKSARAGENTACGDAWYKVRPPQRAFFIAWPRP